MAIRWNSVAVRKRVQEAVMRGVVKGTEVVRDEAISLILNTPKTGRIYRRRSVEHQASAPGEPPASDTGRLVNSIATKYDVNTLSGTVVVDAEYGPYLEFGTQTIEPRPFLRPALANKRGALDTFIRDEITKEFS